MGETAIDAPVGGRFDGMLHRLAVRVYFEDTDLSGAVYHANYLRYMERGRSDMVRVAGIDQRAAHEAGEGAYAVASLTIRYLAPARLDDALVILTRVDAIRAASLTIHQQVMRGTLNLAEADVIVAFVAPSGRPRRHPAEWQRRFRSLVRSGEFTP